MRHKRFYIILLMSMIPMMLLTQCKQKPANTVCKSEAVPATAPAFDVDSAFHFVKSQTDFGPRVPSTAAHDSCGDYLYQTLLRYCDTVVNQHFTATAYNGTLLHGTNIVGTFNPDAEKRILLAAHWDSRHVADHDPEDSLRKFPIDGANDGASGVGVLLEVARQLSVQAPQVGVDILLFDLEDYGPDDNYHVPAGEWWALGSQYWSKTPHREGYTASYGILLDMVGYANARFRYEYTSYLYANDVLKKVWGAAYKLGFSSTFLTQQANPIIDDHTYVNKIAQIPMIDIVHQEDATGTGFPSTWHTHEDNINHIDRDMLGIVGKTLLYVIYNEK